MVLRQPSSLPGPSGSTDCVIPTADIPALRARTGSALAQTTLLPGWLPNSVEGGGAFTLDPADTTSPDNNGTIIVDASNRRWKRALDSRAISVADFGITGTLANGTASAQAAFQDLIAYCLANSIHTIELEPTGNYKISGLDIPGPILFTSPSTATAPNGTSTLPTGGARFSFDQTAPPRRMLWWKATTAAQWIVGGGLHNVAVDGMNTATGAVQSSSGCWFYLLAYLMRCTGEHFLLDDLNGRVNLGGYFPFINVSIGPNAGTQAAKGVVITGDAVTRGGNTSHEFGRVQIEYHDGDPFTFEECDSVHVTQLKTTERVVNTGLGRVRWKKGNTFPAAKNFIAQGVRLKNAVEDSTSNSIGYMNGEGCSVEMVGTGTGVLDYKVVDHKAGDVFATPSWRMQDNLEMPPGHGYARVGTPVIFFVGGAGAPGIAFDSVIDETWTWFRAPPRDWNDGKITGYRINLIRAAAGGTSVATRFRVELTTRAHTAGLGVTEFTDEQTLSVADVATTQHYVTATLATPVPYVRGDSILCHLTRVGTHGEDTLTADVYVMSFELLFESFGPNTNPVTMGPFAPTSRVAV